MSLFQRDHILRVIEQLAQALVALRERILGGEGGSAELQQEIRSIASRVGLDLGVARAVDPTTLRMLMGQAGTADPGRCWLMAELLFLEALRSREAGQPAAAIRDLDRALLLHGWNEPDWQPFPELPPVAARIEEMRALRAELDPQSPQ